MTPDTNLPSPPAEAVSEPSGFLGRLIGVYFSPGETFKAIGRAPKVVVPMIVLAVVFALVTVVFFNRLGVERLASQRIEQQLASGRITPEQAEQQRDAIRNASGVLKWLSRLYPVGAAVASVIIALAIAGLAKLVSMVMGLENEFGSLLSVTVYATLAVSIISSIV